MFEVHPYQCFYGTLIRGPKDAVSKFAKSQLKNAHVIGKNDIGHGEVIWKVNCLGYQVDCRSDDCKDLAIAIFTTLGAQASLFTKKAGSTTLEQHELGETDPDLEALQVYTECPDKTIHEKYILCSCGEPMEFKYAPSAYIVSMVSDDVINEGADTEPEVSCEYLEEYDEELDMEGHIVIL